MWVVTVRNPWYTECIALFPGGTLLPGDMRMCDKETVRILNRLWKSERITHGYYGFLAGFGRTGRLKRELESLRRDHGRYAEMIEQYIRSLGGIITHASIPNLIAFRNAIGASFADPGQVLRKVYQEEDVGLRAYEQALANPLDDQTRALLAGIAHDTQQHLAMLQGLFISKNK
jgi:hypothetical protein